MAAPILPHADLGDPECCGCLVAVIFSSFAENACNDCNAVVRTVALGDIDKELTEMELSLSLASVMCQHCRSVNLFTGFSEMSVYRCQFCGKVANVGEAGA